jgi:hypothetical protein
LEREKTCIGKGKTDSDSAYFHQGSPVPDISKEFPTKARQDQANRQDESQGDIADDIDENQVVRSGKE